MNNKSIHSSQLFTACCVALLVTAMTFAIRAGILNQLGTDFGLSANQLGWVNAMAFLGFPLSMMIGGLVYNAVGAKKLMLVAFLCHLIGLGLTITATGFWSLIISTFFIGLANGAVEAACNPLIADIYHDKKTTMLNRFHVWFPGGIVVGAVLSKFMTEASWSWQMQIAIMLVPAVVYGAMAFKLQFPEINAQLASTADNIKGLASPLFLFMVACMTITTTAELGTQQWINVILGASGASPMAILAMVTGLMAVGRFFAGPVIHRLNPSGVLLFSAVFTTIGIYSMSVATGNLVYVAAVVFALGVTYFWPTMVGFIAENVPQSGALGLSLIGGAGMFAVSIWNPIIGGWIDSAKEQALQAQATGAEAELIAGQTVLGNLTLFPLALIFLFSGLFWYMRKQSN